MLASCPENQLTFAKNGEAYLLSHKLLATEKQDYETRTAPLDIDLVRLSLGCATAVKERGGEKSIHI
jgi:hypothetical protein